MVLTWLLQHRHSSSDGLCKCVHKDEHSAAMLEAAAQDAAEEVANVWTKADGDSSSAGVGHFDGTTGTARVGVPSPSSAVPLVGERVRVYWTGEMRFYQGTIAAAEVAGGRLKHRVRYDDGDDQWHDLADEIWGPLAGSVAASKAERDAGGCTGDSKPTQSMPVVSPPAPPALAPQASIGAPPDTVHSVLARMHLEQYWQAFDKLGYDDLEFLRMMPRSELVKVAQATEMKTGHQLKFVMQFATV